MGEKSGGRDPGGGPLLCVASVTGKERTRARAATKGEDKPDEVLLRHYKKEPGIPCGSVPRSREQNRPLCGGKAEGSTKAAENQKEIEARRHEKVTRLLCNFLSPRET